MIKVLHDQLLLMPLRDVIFSCCLEARNTVLRIFYFYLVTFVNLDLWVSGSERSEKENLGTGLNPQALNKY